MSDIHNIILNGERKPIESSISPFNNQDNSDGIPPTQSSGATIQKIMLEIAHYPNGLITILKWYPIGGPLAKHRKKKPKKGQGKQLGVSTTETEEEVL